MCIRDSLQPVLADVDPHRRRAGQIGRQRHADRPIHLGGKRIPPDRADADGLRKRRARVDPQRSPHRLLGAEGEPVTRSVPHQGAGAAACAMVGLRVGARLGVARGEKPAEPCLLYTSRCV